MPKVSTRKQCRTQTSEQNSKDSAMVADVEEVSLEHFQEQFRARLKPVVPWNLTLGEQLYLAENTIMMMTAH